MNLKYLIVSAILLIMACENIILRRSIQAEHKVSYEREKANIALSTQVQELEKRIKALEADRVILFTPGPSTNSVNPFGPPPNPPKPKNSWGNLQRPQHEIL